MKTKRKTHGKIIFVMLSVALLLLAVFSVGMTYGKFTTRFAVTDETKQLKFEKKITIDRSTLG